MSSGIWVGGTVEHCAGSAYAVTLGYLGAVCHTVGLYIAKALNGELRDCDT